MSKLPNAWVETTLGKVYNFSSGLSKKRDQFGFGYDFLTFKDVFSNWFLPHKLNSLANTTKQERYKCSIKRGDVFLTRTSETQEELGMSSVALKDYKDAAFNGFTKRLRPKEGLNTSPEFIGYYFRSRYFRATIQTMASMTTRASLNNDTLSILPILLPPIPEQKAIAAVLSAFDEKIELLREQNETLETIAQTVFKEWFVNFNYPGATGEMIDSELGEIPKGWRVEKLGKELEVKRGGSPRPIKDYISDSGYRWLKISDATASTSPFIFEIKEHIKEEGLKNTTLLKQGALVLSNSATPGVPKFLEVDSCIHDGWLHFPKTSIFSYQYLYLFFKHIRESLLQQGNGSVFKNLKTDILKSWNMIVPDTETMKNFNKILMPVFEKIKNNASQIQTLTKTRDTLLPKLMSGKIRVKGFEQ